jgi:hypothetical protein
MSSTNGSTPEFFLAAMLAASALILSVIGCHRRLSAKGEASGGKSTAEKTDDTRERRGYDTQE